jgi:hypothetical protein
MELPKTSQTIIKTKKNNQTIKPTNSTGYLSLQFKNQSTKQVVRLHSKFVMQEARGKEQGAKSHK